MKNILFLIASMRMGGAERVLSLLLANLDPEKIRVHLILMDDGIDYAIPDYVSVKILGKENKSSFRKLIELPFLAFRLQQYLKRHNIERVVSFLYRPGYVNVLAKIFRSRHVAIVGICSATSRYWDQGILGEINLLLIRTLFGKADLIISPSEGVKRDLEILFSFNNRQIVINNPIDLDYITILINEKVNDGFQFNKERKYIISVGRLIPLKRNKDLLLAFHTIRNELTGYDIIFLGEGEEKKALQKLAEKLLLNSNVHFLGNVSNPFYYLHRSDIFILTSEIEGFSNVLIEAMACKIPVISANCKYGPNEILENGKLGLLYEVGDIRQLSLHLLKTDKDSKLRQKLVQDAYRKIPKYNIDHIIKQYEEAIM